MAIRLPDRWVWDSWYVWDGDVCHAFYLCASRGLSHPDERHRAPAIGHATSRDLLNWTVLPDALAPSMQPAFDSWTTWTGSTVRDDEGTWWMFYTGSSREDGGLVQRIGAATSTDLIRWERVPDAAVVEADPRWYEQLDTSLWHDQAWRDPWVFRQPDGAGWGMLVTARSSFGAPRERGVVGYATSADLATWEVRAPLSSPDQGFGQLEVLQFAEVDGVSLMIFCCGWRELGEDRLAAIGRIDATYSLVCPHGLSDLDVSRARPFLDTVVYAGRVVRMPTGEWFLLGFLNGPNGEFLGEISDPIPVSADPVLGLIPR